MRSVVVSLCTALVAAVFLPSQAAVAASNPCGLQNHCYAVGRVLDQVQYGVYGTWNRAPMGAGGASASEPRFVTSEMWLIRETEQAWVEAGHTAGWLAPAGASGYHAFMAWNTTNGTYSERSFGSVTPNASVTDEFQIARGSSANTFTVYFNGARRTTPDVGFWQAGRIDYGGEVATGFGTSDLFRMQLQRIDASGGRANLGVEGVGNNLDPPLYWDRPGESAWNWRIRQ